MHNYGGSCQNGPVVEIFIVPIGEIEIPRGPAFATKFGEVGGVCVGSKNHVTGMVADASIRMHCNIIKELVACFRDYLGSVGLSHHDCA